MSCWLAGTSLVPTQSWQDSWLILLQPQCAESLFSLELWATSQSTGDIPQGRKRQGGHSAWYTVAGHPALLTSGFLVWLPVAQMAPAGGRQTPVQTGTPGSSSVTKSIERGTKKRGLGALGS